MRKRKLLFVSSLLCIVWMYGNGYGEPVFLGGSLELISQKPCSPPPGPIGSIVMSFDHSDRTDELKSLIKDGADINETFCNNQSPLIFASRLPFAKYDPVVKILISSGAHIKHRDDTGYTALHYASYAGRLETVKILIENGAEINSQANDGATPLSQAGDYKIIEYLLSKGADPNLVDRNGDSPLHGLVGEIKIINLLIKKNAKIDLQNKEGSTPLHISIKGIPWNHSLINTARHLIENGANPYLKDNSGKTPLDYADEKSKKELLHFIKSFQSK